MFLLLTGASGVGKSTARRLLADQLGPSVESVELGHLMAFPNGPTIAWRQQATEAAVQRALALRRDGRHLLLAGDPVAVGEVVAAPSAAGLDAISACLLDVDAPTQAARLSRRGDDPSLLDRHHAFAEWMRGHALDPQHRLEVLRTNAWEAMRWERLLELDPARGEWGVRVIDTSPRTEEQVAREVGEWCREALAGTAAAIRVPAGT